MLLISKTDFSPATFSKLLTWQNGKVASKSSLSVQAVQIQIFFISVLVSDHRQQFLIFVQLIGVSSLTGLAVSTST